MTTFLQFLASGTALGGIYALVCLGFVVVYRCTGVLNLAQGGLMMLGAFLTFQLVQGAHLPFAIAVLSALVALAAFGYLVQFTILRHMVARPVMAIIMVTLGLLYVIQPLVTSIWGFDLHMLGDPWGSQSVRVANVALQVVDLWSMGVSAFVLVAFFVFFRYSRLGIAMRATAADPEAAAANGISSSSIAGLAWAVAGVVAVASGVMLTAGSRGVSVDVGDVAFSAFPAMMLGGAESTFGAAVGGLIIGVTEVFTAGYIEPNAPWLGANFHVVMPYVLMILIMLVRPQGIFGRERVERV
jgi:branched-chain amino acid transport system permease protein